MKTIRRLLHRDITVASLFTALAFLSLFFFIDFVDALEDLARSGSTLWQAALGSLLAIPGHFYELFPIAVLIGTIYTLSRMAQASEFTILRTGGLGPARALSLLASIGLAFAVLTWLVGDYVAPLSERLGAEVRAGVGGALSVGGNGAWLKDRRSTPEGERNFSVNIQSATTKGELRGVRIFEFDGDARLLERVHAARASVDGDGQWTLMDVDSTHWAGADDTTRAPTVTTTHEAQRRWPSGLTARVVAAAVLPIDTMNTVDLFRYSQHLAENEQAGQRYEIQFWKRALYPFACVVMVALALPFAYLQARGGGIGLKVFGGIMLGISFVLVNNVAGHLGLLRDWTPWVVAAVPGLLYLLMSMAAFTWLVRFR